MGQINITRGNSFQIPPTNALGLSYNDTGDLIKVNADGSSTILIQGTSESVPNILANAGVGLEAGLPASPTQGDIYVTTDTLKVFTAIGISSWNQTDLTNKQFVTDTSGTSWILYQYNGTELKVVGDVVPPQTWLDFVPQDPEPAHTEGRMYYDDVLKSHVLLNDQTPVKLSIGSELWARLENDTGVSLLNGKVGYVTGAVPPFIKCGLAVASDINQSIRALGLFTQDIADGAQGYITRYGAVRGLNTSAWTANTVLWLSADTPGELTGVRPLAPDYAVRIGVVIYQDAINGVIGVDTLSFNGTDTTVNIEGVLNGIVTHTPDIVIVSDGVDITATVTNQDHPGESLPFLLDGTRYNLPSGEGVIIPPGADDETLQGSLLYIYLDGSTPTLAIATTAPSIPYCLLAEFAVFDAVRTQADGMPFAYRRSNNAIDNKNGVNDGALGLQVRTLNAIRKKLGSNWITGQDGTPTVNNTSIQVTLTAGRAMQFNEATVPSFAGGSYIAYNNVTNQVTYEEIADLISIISDANGGTFLANGRYYTLRLFQLFNSNGVGNSIIATRPLGSYTTSAEAIQDPNNYTVNINDTLIEEIIYPLYDLVIARTGGGGTTVSLVQLTDLRTKLVGGVGGGGASGGGGTDDKARVSATDTTNDYLNPKLTVGDEFTKEIGSPTANETLLLKFKGWIYNAARTFKAIISSVNLTADRTFTWPDITGLIAVFGMTNPFRFGGQVSGGYSIETFSSTKTFNLNNGNSQEMTLTSNIITLTLSNKVNGGSYLIYLVQDTTGSRTIPTPDSTWGVRTDNSADFVTSANAVNLINVNVRPNGTTYYTIETYTP